MWHSQRVGAATVFSDEIIMATPSKPRDREGRVTRIVNSIGSVTSSRWFSLPSGWSRELGYEPQDVGLHGEPLPIERQEMIGPRIPY